MPSRPRPTRSMKPRTIPGSSKWSSPIPPRLESFSPPQNTKPLSPKKREARRTENREQKNPSLIQPKRSVSHSSRSLRRVGGQNSDLWFLSPIHSFPQKETMRYLPKSPAERKQMLANIGAASIDDLFSVIPAEYRLARDLDVPRQHGESEIIDFFRAAAAQNTTRFTSFLGAGAYRHYRPVIIDSLVQRGEFLTSYTPYQAEITQGTLQAIFEFQTMICELTGMDIANASMYDGSTGAAES